MGAALNSSFPLIAQMCSASKPSQFSFLPILTTAPCFSHPLPLLRSALIHLCLDLPSRLGFNPLPLHKSHSSPRAIPAAPTTSCLPLAPPFHCLDPLLVLHSPELNPNFSPWQQGPHDLTFTAFPTSDCLFSPTIFLPARHTNQFAIFQKSL